KELLELIERRVGYSKLKWNDVFRCSKEEFLEFMQFKLRNGPRDLLRFIDIVFDSVGNGKAMAIVDFRRKEEDYRLYAFQQMQVVYGYVFKNIGDFVREMFKKGAERQITTFRDEYEKMRLESRPSEATYEDPAFSDHKEAFRSITESGCVDVYDSELWLPPYSEGYYVTLGHNKATKIPINCTIQA